MKMIALRALGVFYILSWVAALIPSALILEKGGENWSTWEGILIAYALVPPLSLATIAFTSILMGSIIWTVQFICTGSIYGKKEEASNEDNTGTD